MKFETFVLYCGISELLFCSLVFGKMEIIVDEKIVNCTEPGDLAGAMDFSQVELVAESDTTIVSNGTIRFLKPVKAPWKVHAYAERFTRGQWTLYGYNKKIDDFCTVMHNPTEIYYKWFKVCPKCPLEVGAIIKSTS